MLDKMLNYENPVWQFMNRVADLLILNVLFMIFSIPIVTIGASYTALTYVTVKIVRKEDTYVWKEFWASFKSNFKQATAIWLILLPFIIILTVDVVFWFSNTTALPNVLKVTTVIVVLIVLAITIYAFPVLSHFDNTVKNTMQNAFLISLINIPYTIYFIVLLILPILIVFMEIRMLMAYLMIGFSGPSLLAAIGWSKIFKKLEPPKEEEDEPDGDNWELEEIVEDSTKTVETEETV